MKIRRSIVRQSPIMGSHLVGPWHLVGATMESTLDLNRIVKAISWELNPRNNNANDRKKPKNIVGVLGLAPRHH